MSKEAYLSRTDQREWLVKLSFERQFKEDQPYEREALLESHGLPLDSPYLNGSLDSLVENEESIDRLISDRLVDWSLSRLSPIDLAILRVGVNEIVYTRYAPLSVIINECVELSKKYSQPSSYKFINGLLGKLGREKEEGEASLE